LFLYICINIYIINKEKLHIISIEESFKEQEILEINDILSFYRETNPSIKKNTIYWKIHDLVEKGILKRVGRGRYQLGTQNTFSPQLSNKLKTLYKKLDSEFPYLEKSVWNTSWLNQWMLHIPNVNMIFIEVEKGSEENVFYFLSSIQKNTFLNPSEELLLRYANNNKTIYIIKNLVSGAPIQEIKKIKIPTIEKIIVDLIIDKKMLSAFQEKDLDNILDNVFDYYTINKDKLLHYANRRGKKELVKKRIAND